ncbi:uncharacterized protein DUF2878 [Halospina denitrificans]|uniref:Uncharacterized protein DUF2878 n=1 Tax=Halospina denitrificans TaxID=332522 RepID=A0A4R7JUA2_9GAMM|nr:DUF2878 domain-containing protein [Halospina denitrificans]TDT41406.1 uncharacterized protein DUF2878 [Halospina denitrificans]
MRSLANFILFQLGWCVAVLYPGTLAALVLLGIVAVHLLLISAFPLRELRFIIMVTVLGSVLDVVHRTSGVLDFPGYVGAYSEGMIPLWLVMLWAVFATAVNHCLYWMRNYRVILFGLPPFAGAFAYYTAEQFGAIEIGHGLLGILAIAIGWGLVYPLMVRISIWLESIEEAPLAEQRW